MKNSYRQEELEIDCDVAIVGAGIVGLAVGYEIAQRYPHLSVMVLDKEKSVAAHQTGHNSGVIHSGIYYVPGSLKAELCVEGAKRLYEYCRTKNIPHERCGKLIVARNQSDLPKLRELFERGSQNGVLGIRWLEAHEIEEVEPNCVGLAAVHSPNTGIVDYVKVAEALAKDLQTAGGTIRFSTEVKQINRSGAHTELKLSGSKIIRARFAIACAGLWSDRLASASGQKADVRILPFRGAYLDVDTGGVDAKEIVRGMIYPVPDPDLPFLGVHITRHIDGRISLGPTAMIGLSRDGYGPWDFRISDIWSIASWPGSWIVLKRFWKTALVELKFRFNRNRFVKACSEFMPSLSDMRIERHSWAGVRAQAVRKDGDLADDFIITATEGAVHIRNAPSPAATSALAISRYVADQVESSLKNLDT